MRKWLIFALAAVLCVTLMGCGEKEKEQEKEETTPTQTSAHSTHPHDHTHAVGTPHASAGKTTLPSRRYIYLEEALEIAAEHYDIQPGDIHPQNGYEMSYAVVHPATTQEPYYIIRLQWLVLVDGNPSHWSELDRIRIDAFTGAVTTEE